MDVDDSYNDETGISNKEWFELDVEQESLLEGTQQQKEIIRNRKEVQEEIFQNFKVYTSVWMESDKKKQQDVALLF